MTAIEEIIKWLSSDDNETELNFESTVTNDNPEFYNTNTEPIEVNCRREVPDYNTDKWEFVYVYSQDTKERLLKEPKSGHSKFRRAMERLLQTASPEEDSRSTFCQRTLQDRLHLDKRSFCSTKSAIFINKNWFCIP